MLYTYRHYKHWANFLKRLLKFQGKQINFDTLYLEVERQFIIDNPRFKPELFNEAVYKK